LTLVDAVSAVRDSYARGGLAPWQLARVGRHIEGGLASRLTNSRLASLVRLSEDHFARAFKASTGCAPHAYVVMRRLERAKALMVGSDLPLSQIAVAAGFSDQSHMSRCFRDKVAVAPAWWRRNAHERARPATAEMSPADLKAPLVSGLHHPAAKGTARET
jgi:transcriptional regulator GlxA family with amidase domain